MLLKMFERNLYANFKIINCFGKFVRRDTGVMRRKSVILIR